MCKAFGCCRMTVSYKAARYGGCRPTSAYLRAIAQERHRFGYRRLLRREGYLINHKKLFRLYRRGASPWRPQSGDRDPPMTVLTSQNDRWSLDFVSDQLMDGAAASAS
jgi:putative transposase